MVSGGIAAELRATQLPTARVAIWHLGQAGVAIKGTGDSGFIGIDPYLTHSIEEADPDTEFVRQFEPPGAPEVLAGARAILITHSHNDHLDVVTLNRIARASPGTTFVVPAPNVSIVTEAGIAPDQVHPARAGMQFEVGAFHIEPVAEPHPVYEEDVHGNQTYLGYLITVAGVRLYHAGDTFADQRLLGRVEAFQPDIVFLPINGADFARTARGITGNMNYREAADFGVAAGADLIIPIHYDLFANNRDNPAYFVDYLFHTYPAQKFHMMVPGERFIYMPARFATEG